MQEEESYRIGIILLCCCFFCTGIYGLGLLIGTVTKFLLWIFDILDLKSAKFFRGIIQYDKTDFANEYYREILKNNSPLVLGYLDNFEIDKNKLIAELIYLKKTGIIEVSEGTLLLNENKSLNGNFYQDEILKKISNGKLKISNLEKYLLDLRKQVAKYAEEQSLIKIKKENLTEEEIKKKLKHYSNKINSVNYYLIGLLVICIAAVLTIFFSNLIIFEIVSNVVIFFSYGICFIGLLFLISIIRNGNERKITCFDIIGNKFYKRTQKGKELNQKLEGLKHYLKDYSLLSEREAKEIELWEDYLIYSVMFGQNKKVIEEYEKYIEIEEDDGN